MLTVAISHTPCNFILSPRYDTMVANQHVAVNTNHMASLYTIIDRKYKTKRYLSRVYNGTQLVDVTYFIDVPSYLFIDSFQ